MSEFSGRLSERVRFEGRSDLRSDAGNRASGWALLFERWARVEPVRRSDATVTGGDTMLSQRRWRVTLRDGVQPTLDMRMRWRGLTLRPTGIEVDPALPGRLVIHAEDDSRGGPDAEQP